MSTRPGGAVIASVTVLATVLAATVVASAVADAAPTASGAATVAAQRDGACPTASGVTVMVDFRELGGGVHVRCATGAVNSGLEALQGAGIEYRTAVRFPGFVCRIADRPANDPCVDASPATAYWSYWVAARGGEWCYSNWGAGNRRPPPGSVEGWSFSLHRNASTAPPPGIAPPDAVPGTPASLPASDCDQRPSSPTTPAPTAPPGRSTAPDPTAAPSRPATPSPPPEHRVLAPPAPAGDSGTAGGGGGTSPPAGGATGPSTHGSRPGTPGPDVAPEDDAPGDQPENEPDEQDDQPASEVLDAVRDADDDPASSGTEGGDERELAAVDLGRSDGAGSPVPTLAAATVIVALGGMTWWRRRRAGTG